MISAAPISDATEQRQIVSTRSGSEAGDLQDPTANDFGFPDASSSVDWFLQRIGLKIVFASNSKRKDTC